MKNHIKHLANTGLLLVIISPVPECPEQFHGVQFRQHQGLRNPVAPKVVAEGERVEDPLRELHLVLLPAHPRLQLVHRCGPVLHEHQRDALPPHPVYEGGHPAPELPELPPAEVVQLAPHLVHRVAQVDHHDSVPAALLDGGAGLVAEGDRVADEGGAGAGHLPEVLDAHGQGQEGGGDVHALREERGDVRTLDALLLLFIFQMYFFVSAKPRSWNS